MISNHFPFTYGHAHAWLILVALLVIGAWVRHFFNLRHTGRTVWWIPVTAALAIAGVAIAIRPAGEGAAAKGGAVPFARAQAVVRERCVPCHSEHPTNSSFSVPPKGIRFDTPAQIAAQADAIEQQAVVSKAMPLGNATGMTQAERDLLGRWLRQGAKIP
jgi:uncharacterized membrane protein